MGYAVRTDRHRYVEWRNWNTDVVQARELYDHEKDHDENKNLAKEDAQYENLEQLQQILRSGWKAALPEK
jgi:hypothetical protein